MVGQKLGIPEAKTVANIDKYGNTTAATIPLGLSEAWRKGRCGPGSKVLLAAFGSGYTWGAAVLTLQACDMRLDDSQGACTCRGG